MLYSVVFRTPAAAVSTAICELNTTSTQSCRIMEVGVVSATGVVSGVSIGHPSTASVSPTFLTNGWTPGQSTIAGFLAEQDSNAPLAKTTVAVAAVTSMATCSTTVSPVFRRFMNPATVGVGVIWTFPKGLFMPVSSTGQNAMCIFNVTATGPTYDVWIVIDE